MGRILRQEPPRKASAWSLVTLTALINRLVALPLNPTISYPPVAVIEAENIMSIPAIVSRASVAWKMSWL